MPAKTKKTKTPAKGKIGVMVCGHGSRSESASREFAAFVRHLPDRLAPWPVEFGYLEFATPIISTGLDRLREKGATDILAVPGMLFAAGHVKNDIPALLRDYAAQHNISIRYGRELGLDDKMLTAASHRIGEAMAKADKSHGKIAPHHTCLVVIGRGASDPDANANAAKLGRLLMEAMGFGWVATGYSGVTFPLVEPCLSRVVGLGFKRIMVFPYFLFSGILIDRIYGFTDKVAAAHPNTQFIKADYLGDHPLVVDSLVGRVHAILTGDNHMNCSLCKYRAPLPGFEAEVGLPQTSHHHHAEGAGAAAAGCNPSECNLCDEFCTGECRLQDHDHDHAHHHNHTHTHHPYPHAKHPLGPLSVVRKKG